MYSQLFSFQERLAYKYNTRVQFLAGICNHIIMYDRHMEFIVIFTYRTGMMATKLHTHCQQICSVRMFTYNICYQQ